MAILDWFRSKPEPDFESLLQQLSTAILDKQQRLSEIKLRERRASLAFTLYAFGLWALYTALWWLDLLPLGLVINLVGGWTEDDEGGQRYPEWLEGVGGKALLGVPSVVGPFGIIFVRRVVKMWYTRQEREEEKQLRELRIKQRSTIEDIKKKTNYYTTKNLLEKYDEGPGKGPQPQPQDPSSLRRRAFPLPPDVRQRAISTPSSPAGQGSPSPAPRNGLGSSPASPLAPGPLGGQAPVAGTPHPPGSMRGLTGQQQQTPFPQQPMSPFDAALNLPPPTPPVKQWYDRLADAVLGEDPSTTTKSDLSKFALVCEGCFAHNGLVEEKKWGDTQYICPKCSHFNPSPNSRRSGITPSTSSTSTGAAKQHQLAQSMTHASDDEDEVPVEKPVATAKVSKKSAGGAAGKKGRKAAVVADEGEMDVDQDRE